MNKWSTRNRSRSSLSFLQTSPMNMTKGKHYESTKDISDVQICLNCDKEVCTGTKDCMNKRKRELENDKD